MFNRIFEEKSKMKTRKLIILLRVSILQITTHIFDYLCLSLGEHEDTETENHRALRTRAQHEIPNE